MTAKEIGGRIKRLDDLVKGFDAEVVRLAMEHPKPMELREYEQSIRQARHQLVLAKVSLMSMRHKMPSQ